MKTLIVRIGALGGIIAARLQAGGFPVRLATRTAESAAALEACGLRVSGVGGSLAVTTPEVAAISAYLPRDSFDLIVLATNAHGAVEVAPALIPPLGRGGVSVESPTRVGLDFNTPARR